MVVTRFAMVPRTLTFSTLSVIAWGEESAHLRGSFPAVSNNTAIHSLSSAEFCSDTPNWANWWSKCKNEDMGWNPEYCQSSGWTCAGYVAKGWCKNNQCLPPSQTTGVWACGQTLNYPENNCCACGKPTCVPEGGTCGDNNHVSADCCQGLECQQMLGGSQMKCVRPRDDYTMYYDKNAYQPYGCTDIDTNGDAPTGLTEQECRDRCTEDSQCGCVTYARENGQCWRRANCVPSGWTSPYNIGYNVYVKNI